jgi:hypothetical protein
MPDEKPSDETISNAAIQNIHNAMTKNGIKAPMDDLLEREASLGAYVLFAGYQMSEAVKISGAPPSLVAWVKEAAKTYLLVAIEAQQQAHYDLWRDLMGDPAPETANRKPGNNSKGGDHGRNE